MSDWACEKVRRMYAYTVTVGIGIFGKIFDSEAFVGFGTKKASPPKMWGGVVTSRRITLVASSASHLLTIDFDTREVELLSE
jgi:hypothetical protein